MGLNTKCPIHDNLHPDCLCPDKKALSEHGTPRTVEQFKLACILTEEFTDAEVAFLMKDVVFESADEIIEFCAILRTYRPKLEKKFFA